MSRAKPFGEAGPRLAGTDPGRVSRAAAGLRTCRLGRRIACAAALLGATVPSSTWAGEVSAVASPPVLYAAGCVGVLALAGLWLWTLRREVRRQMAARDRAEHASLERLKEQRCLQDVFEATADAARPLDDVVSAVARRLPAGWQHVDVARARVVAGDATADQIGTAPVAATLREPIRVDLEVRGEVTVAYLAHGLGLGPDPFLDEERMLLREIARRLGEHLRQRAVLERLEASERRYRALFDRVPVAVWEEDASALQAMFARLRAAGVGDLRAYIEARPDFLDRAAASIRIVDVNRACLDLYGAPDVATLARNMHKLVFGDAHRDAVRQILVRQFEGATQFSAVLPRATLDGRRLQVLVQTHLPTRDCSRTIVTETDITGEVELRERYRLVTQAANEVVLEHDLARDRIWWSEGLRTTFGHDPASFAPDIATFFTYVHPDDLEALAGDVRRAMDGTVPDQIAHFRLRRADGRYAYIEAHALVMRDGDGAPSRVIASFTDITDRKLAEDRFRIIAQGTNDVVFEYDPRRDHFWWSDGLRTVFGHDPEALAAGVARLDALIHPEDRAAVRRRRRAWLAQPDAPLAMAYRLQRADGRWAHVESHAFVLEDAQDRLERVIGSLVDVSARHAAEERFRVVADVATDLFWDHDLASDITRWGEPAREVVGFDPAGADQRGRAWRAAIHPDDAARVAASYAEAVAGTTTAWSSTYRIRHADGHWLQVSDRCRIIRDQDGRAVRAIGAVVDQTETLKLQARVRTAERLEAMGRLTGAVAHDFNNILAVVMGNGEMLADLLAERPEGRELADAVVQAAERGERLTRQLLAFTRKPAGTVEPVDLAATVLGMREMIEVFLGKNIRLAVAAPDQPAVARVDKALFETALFNLVVNARDAMATGGRLDIDVARVDLDVEDAAQHPGARAGPHVVVAVSDNGVGMDAETLGHVFEPFFTTKRPGKGTGLGLAMVYGFVNQAGGHIRLYSEPGLGTVLRLYFPAAPGNGTTGAATPDGAVAEFDLTGTRVLLVDDDAPVRAQAEQLLRTLGCVVTSVADGVAALAAVRADGAFDVVLSDIVMPGGIDGRALRATLQRERPALPVLLMTGFPRPETPGRDAVDLGDAVVLQKPFRRRDVAARLAAILGAGSAGAQEPSQPRPLTAARSAATGAGDQ